MLGQLVVSEGKILRESLVDKQSEGKTVWNCYTTFHVELLQLMGSNIKFLDDHGNIIPQKVWISTVLVPTTMSNPSVFHTQ